MIRMSPTATDADPRSKDVKDFLAEATALSERVEAMPDGAMKEKLRVALAQIHASIGETKSDRRDAG
jgi:hypothetical protein